MTSAPSENLPREKILEPEPSTTLAEEKLSQTPNDQKLTREIQLKDTRPPIDWLGSALDVTRVVRDSSADVVFVLSCFVDNLSSAILIHGSDCIVGDLEKSLPSSGPAKQSWESVAEIIKTLLNQIEHLKSATDSHIKCLDAELEAQNMIPQQSRMVLVTLTKGIDLLSHSMNHRLSILYPVYRMPAEILELIFEQSTLEERAAVRAFRNTKIYLSLYSLYSTIPRIPTILASTCRRWRTIAFNMTRLWNFLRVPTLDTYYRPHSCVATVAGISPFRQALSHLGASECEVVVVPTTSRTVLHEHLFSIPRSQISVLTIMMPTRSDFTCIPPARVLRICAPGTTGSGNRPLLPCYSVPASALADTRELECHNIIIRADVLNYSMTSLSLSISIHFILPDFSGILSRFPNLTAFALDIINPQPIGTQQSFSSLHHAHIRKLSITNTVTPHFCGWLQQGALSLPSLTHFILLNIYPLSHTGELDSLQSLFVTMTYFDVHKGGEWKCGPYVRRILDLMPLLQQFNVFGTPVKCCLDALLIAPSNKLTSWLYWTRKQMAPM